MDSASIIAHLVNLRWERSLKCYAKNLTYTDIYVYDALDNLYGFSISVQPEIAPLFTVSFNEMFEKKKKDFQKLAGLWLVGEMDNHVAIYGSKVAEGFSAFQRRSCHCLRLDLLEEKKFRTKQTAIKLCFYRMYSTLYVWMASIGWFTFGANKLQSTPPGAM